MRFGTGLVALACAVGLLALGVAAGTTLSPADDPHPHSSGEDSDAPAPPRTIRGHISLNGLEYTTVCSCLDSSEVTNCLPPTRLRIHQQPYNKELGLQPRDVKALLKSPEYFQLLDADHTSFSTVDGREKRAVLATPGGDFGEFLLAVSVFEEASGEEFNREGLHELLSGYLEMLPPSQRFYYATDRAAIKYMQRHVEVNNARGVVALDMRRPREDVRKPLMSMFSESESQGDYFLKAVLDDPSRFSFRGGLVADMLGALHEIFWDHDAQTKGGQALYKRIRYVVFPGKRPDEKAWLSFRSNHHCELAHRAPAFAPSTDGGQVYVSHPRAVDGMRKKLAEYLTSKKAVPGVSDEALAARIVRKGRSILELAAESLGQGMSFYTITVE